MLKKIRQALVREGYTADEIEVLLKSVTELLDKLRTEARASEGQVAQGRGAPDCGQRREAA